MILTGELFIAVLPFYILGRVIFMVYQEQRMDLFAVPNNYYLVQCISADLVMGKGIAVEFNKRFNMKNCLRAKYPNYLSTFQTKHIVGDCILEGRVFNLITKTLYYYKPTYASITAALSKMRQLCVANNVEFIAMPLIGCGLDRLDWKRVSEIIKDIFSDLDITILVCIK